MISRMRGMSPSAPASPISLPSALTPLARPPGRAYGDAVRHRVTFDADQRGPAAGRRMGGSPVRVSMRAILTIAAAGIPVSLAGVAAGPVSAAVHPAKA